MNSIKGKKVVLVGGAGFIGHNIGLQLIKEGCEVHIVDGLSVNNYLAFAGSAKQNKLSKLYMAILNQRISLIQNENIHLHVLDAGNFYPLLNTLNEISPHVVIHLAAVAHANQANKDPMYTFAHSSRTLENALESSRHLLNKDLEQFIYFSSSMVYGNFEGGIVNEETTPNPLGIYGSLKYGGEKLVQAYNQVFGLPFTIIRPSALYGQRCVSRRVIQIFIESALLGEEISINGEGNDRLDFTFIEDLVSGVVCVMKEESSLGEIFNLTYGESRSLKDVLTIVQKYFPGISIKYLPKDKLMPDRGTLSVEKAKRLIGYNPLFPIEIGIETYINWYLKDMTNYVG